MVARFTLISLFGNASVCLQKLPKVNSDYDDTVQEYRQKKLHTNPFCSYQDLVETNDADPTIHPCSLSSKYTKRGSVEAAGGRTGRGLSKTGCDEGGQEPEEGGDAGVSKGMLAARQHQDNLCGTKGAPDLVVSACHPTVR